jgi:Zn ribbon nucleic-acid-binding protein
MSTVDMNTDCPRCNGKDTLNIYSDSKPFESLHMVCSECGLVVDTIPTQATLKGINEYRGDAELPPLEHLVQPSAEWLKNFSEWEPKNKYRRRY